LQQQLLRLWNKGTLTSSEPSAYVQLIFPATDVPKNAVATYGAESIQARREWHEYYAHAAGARL